MIERDRMVGQDVLLAEVGVYGLENWPQKTAPEREVGDEY